MKLPSANDVALRANGKTQVQVLSEKWQIIFFIAFSQETTDFNRNLPVCQKNQRQTKRNRRRTGGTVGCVLCSKSKCLAQPKGLPLSGELDFAKQKAEG